jgi:hypothetical protein
MKFAVYEKVPNNIAEQIMKTRSGKTKSMDDE